jgi:transaldolase
VAAARELEAAGIHTNLILIASIVHAAVCARAGVTAISIAVGPVRHLSVFAIRASKLTWADLVAALP